MTVNEYQELAMTTMNPELSRRDVLINSVMGLCGESGEAIDIVKKWMAQGHELDKEHLAKELGDIAWYLAEAATALEIPLEDILQSNIDKLKQRYPEGFETKRSQMRLEAAKKLDTTARKPAPSIAHAACSRLEPQPKFLPAIRIWPE